MPVADLYIGRTPVWARSTIDAWLNSRGHVALVEPWQQVPSG